MLGVSAVRESIRKGVVAKSQFGESIHESHFQRYYVYIPFLALLADHFVLLEVRAAIGGRQPNALSGGAAIRRDTREFLTTALVTE